MTDLFRIEKNHDPIHVIFINTLLFFARLLFSSSEARANAVVLNHDIEVRLVPAENRLAGTECNNFSKGLN